MSYSVYKWEFAGGWELVIAAWDGQPIRWAVRVASVLCIFLPLLLLFSFTIIGLLNCVYLNLAVFFPFPLLFSLPIWGKGENWLPAGVKP